MQGSLFNASRYPAGFDYQPEFLTPSEEDQLLREISALEFSSVEMRGVVARRRTVHFGWTYGYYARRAEPGPPLPSFLLPYRDRIGEWATLDPASFVEALITEYPSGAPIGWHRDAPQYDIVAGLSLLSACRMRFRPYRSAPSPALRSPRRSATHEIVLARRSAYLMTQESRTAYEHHIPPVAEFRYSVTFRTLR